MAHPNEELLRRSDEAMLEGDMEAFFASYTDDVVVHIGGQSPLAGDYKGLDQLQSLFGDFMARAGEFSFEPHDYLANDEHGVILQSTTWTKGGKSLHTKDTFVFHFRDGKISEFWMFSDDQAAVDAWLSS